MKQDSGLLRFFQAPLGQLLAFFTLLLIEISLLAYVLMLIFDISWLGVIHGLYPESAKNLYLTGLSLFVIKNLYLFNHPNLLKVFQIPFTEKIIPFMQGLTISILTLLLLYHMEIRLKLLAIKSFAPDIYLLLQAIFFGFLIALLEELLFRNFLFEKIKQAGGLIPAMFISSYLYAQSHFLNFTLTWYEILTPITALFFIGFFLAYVYERFGFWNAVGWHTGWIILISYTSQQQVFVVKTFFKELSGGYYPIAGTIGLSVALFLLFFTIMINLHFEKN